MRTQTELQYTLAFDAKGSHVLVRASGVRTRATVMAVTTEIFDAVLAYERSRVLIDVRELKGRLGIRDSYVLVTQVFAKLRGKGVRKAAVVDSLPASHRGWFLETVALNRGFRFRVFTNQEDALEWLES